MILFSATETQFTSNGIGRLSDAVSCTVTEERNGAYELEMTYPVDGAHYSDIALGTFIFCEPSKGANRQAFEIYEITKPLNGLVKIYAGHISYRLDKTPCMPFTEDNVVDALAGLKTNAVGSCPFTFTTDKTTAATYNQRVPASIRERLGGVEGSILDAYGGGEYEFDMYNVKLWDARGMNRGYTIRYGKNLTDLQQEESIADTITGIVPYFTNESTTVTLPEKVLESSSASSFPYPRNVAVDLSSTFENQVPTVAQLRAAGNAYLSSHSVGVPKVNLKVSFVNLADTEEYKDIAVLEDVRLCDTVNVYFEKLGVNATAKVIKTVYDVLKGRYTSIELGDSRTSLAAKIATVEKTVEETPSVIRSAVESATNLITGETGGYVVLHTGEDGKPYEILIMDSEDIDTAVNVWRWNQSGWGHSSTGYNGTYTLAATLDGGFVADFITAGTITGIEINNGSGTFHVDAAGNLTASSGNFTGAINSGSTINGSAISGGTISGTTMSGSVINSDGTYWATLSNATLNGGFNRETDPVTGYGNRECGRINFSFAQTIGDETIKGVLIQGGSIGVKGRVATNPNSYQPGNAVTVRNVAIWLAGNLTDGYQLKIAEVTSSGVGTAQTAGMIGFVNGMMVDSVYWI